MNSRLLTTAPILLFLLAGITGCDDGPETADERQLAAEQEARD